MSDVLASQAGLEETLKGEILRMYQEWPRIRTASSTSAMAGREAAARPSPPCSPPRNPRTTSVVQV
jgi:hypothetical protein